MLTIMTVLDESIKYILGYISLLYMFLFAISISHYALTSKVELNFVNSFLDQYDTIFSGSSEDINSMSIAALIIYFIQTNFMVIVFMNILISVLTDKYDMVM